MKKNKTPLTQPLSERELEWLESFLANLSQTNADFMTLEAIDGLFCALIINPVMAKPADWMNTLFGKKQAFNSDEELENVMMLLIRYWNHASTTIENNLYVPRPLGNTQKWALGFNLGMDYCRKEWDLFLTESENAALLSPIFALEKANDIITEEKRQTLLAQIPPIVYKLFHYWINKIESDKKEFKPKIGRNDPCPCGSGKKYKKCCDA